MAGGDPSDTRGAELGVRGLRLAQQSVGRRYRARGGLDRLRTLLGLAALGAFASTSLIRYIRLAARPTVSPPSTDLIPIQTRRHRRPARATSPRAAAVGRSRDNGLAWTSRSRTRRPASAISAPPPARIRKRCVVSPREPVAGPRPCWTMSLAKRSLSREPVARKGIVILLSPARVPRIRRSKRSTPRSVRTAVRHRGPDT